MFAKTCSCPSISSLDLGANFLEDEQVLEIFGKMPHLNSLILKGNKVVSKTHNYRKRSFPFGNSHEYVFVCYIFLLNLFHV